jgi:molybdopterin synthase catalytic subunit
VTPPTDRDDWVGLSAAPLPLEAAAAWAVLPRCGAVVTFSGHARDHAPGRPGVEALEYEAYDSQVEPRLVDLARVMRTRWSDLGRIVLLHRTGELAITEAAVVVVVSAPHRDHAFEAARFGIDTLKATAPIWKRERWADGEDFGLGAATIGAGSPPS